MHRGPIVSGERLTTRRRQIIPAGEVMLADPEHVEKAFQRAFSFFPAFRKTPLYERIEILERAVERFASHADELARLIHQENHKPLPLAQNEAQRAVVTLKTTLAELWTWREEHFPLDQTPLGAGRWVVVRRFPLGPVLAITPFNYPLNLPMHKVAPALAVGAPVILKPAPLTPLTAIRMVELFLDAGVPPDALHVLPVTNEKAAEMVRDPRIAVLSFTGSAAVGWKLKQSTKARVVLLELGGNAGVIVEPDADLAYAAKRIATGAFAFSGQVCISVQRIFVHRTIRDPFVAHLVEALEQLEAGQLLCPLIHEKATQRVETWIKEALKRGARRVFQRVYTVEGKGVPVQIFEGVPHDLPLWSEEVFGPVALLETYDQLEEALRLVNESRYGLHAGLFTRDIQRIWQAFEDLDVGGLVINDVPTYRADPMPYGGAKASGLLREGPRYAMEAYTEPRALVLNRPES